MSDETSNIFTINILDVKVTNIGNLQNVIKLVTWSITGAKGGLTETVGSYTTELPAPTSENFTPFEQLTQTQIASWVETHDERVFAAKTYIENRLDAEIAKASLESKPLPWVPVSPSSTSEAPVPAPII